MIGLIQRVTHASVVVNHEIIGDINTGILLLLGVEKNDNEKSAIRLLERVMTYRIFEDGTGRMNRSLNDIQGDLLIVPQFTLAANTNKGTRPSFTPAAEPKRGKVLFDFFLQHAKTSSLRIQSGQFGADMQVSLTNDGPITFWLQTNAS
ncbi:MAG TPA: D-tyrosyl-tRNA(Tyr) deacylase [Thiothrix sp.]|nr:D-tyrosyl-tRNA(Tyr) deacylase [Thiothrix sp.]